MASSNALILVEFGHSSIVGMACIRRFTSCWLSGGGTILVVGDGCSDVGAHCYYIASPYWALVLDRVSLLGAGCCVCSLLRHRIRLPTGTRCLKIT